MAKTSRPNTRSFPKGLLLLHEDKEILVVEKPAGLLTMGTEKEKERTVYWALTDYVRKGSALSRNRVFIVHRLDRDASGILIFAKSSEIKKRLQDQWPETQKTYVAVVHGRPEKSEATLSSWLYESVALRVYVTGDSSKGKLARTAYRVLKWAKNFSLLEIDLLTGRKHQIRVQLADSGLPIAGDKKYGRDGDHARRMALHALSLTIRHPGSGKEMTFRTEIPEYFLKLLGGIKEPRVPQPSGPPSFPGAGD